jgi:hypothetical protein
MAEPWPNYPDPGKPAIHPGSMRRWSCVIRYLAFHENDYDLQ